MSWTEERVAMAIDMMVKGGYSAGQTALALGGVTRNAVLGKLYRLGYVGIGGSSEGNTERRAPSPPRAIGMTMAEKSAISAKVGAPRGGVNGSPAGSPSARIAAEKRSATMAARRPASRPIDHSVKSREEAAAPLQVVRIVSTREKAVEADDVVTRTAQADTSSSWATARAVLSLEPNHCRWPIGDTQSDGFTFCCARKQEGSSYCAEHRRISVSTFQPKAVRAPRDPNVRANSQIAAERREAVGAWG